MRCRKRGTPTTAGRINEHDRYLVDARTRAKTLEFQQTYRPWRPMVERSIAWIMCDGHRRCRYRGIARKRLELSPRVAAVNLSRLLALGLEYNAAGRSPDRTLVGPGTPRE